VRRDGTAVWVAADARPLTEPDGTPYGALCTYVDVTERVRRERRIRREADSDPLTGLANRRALERALARRLSGCVRERDVVARIGGDEFVLVLPDLHPEHDAASECAARVRAALSAPLAIDGAEPRLGAATGVACFPRDGADGAQLLAHADRAMYRAKR
jgi:GGDEF domain-containing protein